MDVCKRLKDKFGPQKATKHKGRGRKSKAAAPIAAADDADFAALDASLVQDDAPEEIEGVLPGDEDFEDEDGGDDDDARDVFDALDDEDGDMAPLYVLPLFSSLGAKHQAKVSALTQIQRVQVAVTIPSLNLC